MVSIRRIRKGEGQVFRAVRLAALADSPDAFGSSYESALARTPESWVGQSDSTASGGQRSTFLAFDEGQTVGITALYRDPDEALRGELLQVWVAPGYRGTGLAGRLMDAALDWARAVGILRAVAGVAETNHRVIAFYEKHGFVRGQVPNDGETIYLLRIL